MLCYPSYRAAKIKNLLPSTKIQSICPGISPFLWTKKEKYMKAYQNHDKDKNLVILENHGVLGLANCHFSIYDK